MSKKFIRLQWIAALALAVSPVAASAATFTLQNLTAGDYDKIVKEFSSDFSYSTVTPASSLGGLGGFELGVIGGKTKSPELYNLVKTADASTSFKGDLYHGGVVGRVGLPFSLTAEVLVFPKKKFKEVSFQEAGGAVMWTPTDDLLSWLPVNISTKFHVLKTKVAYSQNVTVTAPVAGTGVANIAFDDTLWGLQALVSKKFFFLEPYAGLGFIRAKGDLKVDASGTTTFFSGNFASNNEAVSKPSSVQFLAGLDARFLLLSVGAEYQKAFGTHSITGRLSFRF
ncbi:MAG: DUF6588 family protein [Bdellovibrionota bacterium]